MDRRRRGQIRGPARQCALTFPELVKRGVRPDMVTDQTSAHDPINGYLPARLDMAEWREKRESDPKAVEKAAALDESARAGDGRFPEAGRADA